MAWLVVVSSAVAADALNMFSTSAHIAHRQGRFGTSRRFHLQRLVTEFQHTSSDEAKQQIAANLANFAYDPFNYECMRELNVIDLFLDCLAEETPLLQQFGMGGLCNCCNDPLNAQRIVKDDGLDLIISCLSSSEEATVISAITTLLYLYLEPSVTGKEAIKTGKVLDAIKKYATSKRIKLANVATVFLDCVAVSSNATTTSKRIHFKYAWRPPKKKGKRDV